MGFDYGNVLMQALRITWKHKSFWLFLIIPTLLSMLIAAVFVTPVFLLSDAPDSRMAFIVLWLAALLLTFAMTTALFTMGSASLLLGILRIERGEDATSFLTLLRDGLTYFWPILGVVLMVQVGVGSVITLVLVFIFLLILVTGGVASLCAQPILILLMPVSFLVSAVMVGGMMAVIGENLRPVEAVKRGIYVVSRHVWKFVVLSLVAYFATMILTSVASLVLMLPAMLLPALLSGGAELSGQDLMLVLAPFIFLFVLLTSSTSGIGGVFMNAIWGVSYLRLRAELPQSATS